MNSRRQRTPTNPLDIVAFTGIPIGLMQSEMALELTGIYGTKLLQDLGRIIGYYLTYEDGAEFFTEGHGNDYTPADLPFMRSANLIDKQARFMFGHPAEFKVTSENPDEDSDTDKEALSVLQNLVDSVLERNAFAEKCLKGFKDACIGERVAVTLDFNDNGIFIRFLPSFSFLHEFDENGDLYRLITFYTMEDSTNKAEQRIYKKRWSMANDQGLCEIGEWVFDGNGKEIEVIQEPYYTEFTYIPAWVIINDGLTGDQEGVSDIRRLAMYEEWYSKLANADIDSGRQNMNPIRYAQDMNPESTKRERLSIAAGAFWDLTSDTELQEGRAGSVGILESSMSYSAPLAQTLDRIATTMNDTVDVPNINADSMTGVITSGKSLKAIYWPLIVRCDEKLISWLPALRFVANTIIDGARLYPNSAAPYLLGEVIPDIDYVLTVDNPYSLPEDDIEERQNDIAQVNAQTMSRKTFIQKWQGLTSKEADKELQQIAFEKQLFETSYTQSMISAANNAVRPIQRSDSGVQIGRQSDEENESAD